jgi:hypothetical protein
VQHEREPLVRGEPVQHYLEGEPDRVGEQRLIFGMAFPPARDLRHNRATTVVSQPARFPISSGPERLSRNQAS